MSSFPAVTASAATQLWTQRASSVLSGAAASVTFSSLTDSAYRLTCNFSPTATLRAKVTLNNDGGANYEWQQATAFGGANASARNTGITYWQINNASTVLTDQASGFQMVIQKPLAAQHAHALMTVAEHTTAGNNQGAEVWAGRWTNTANLITRIDVFTSTSTFKTGSVFTVEGIA